MLPSQINHPLGAVAFGHIVIEPTKEPETYPSTYALFAASVLRVGVAKSVIFYELSDRLPVGAVRLFKGVV